MAWTTFGTNPTPTGQQLDANLLALARMGAFPATASGTGNAIVLTLLDANAPPNNAYQNYVEYAFIVLATNSGVVTIKVGSLAALNAYKDTSSGPAALVGSELVQNCLCVATYDSTLNSNAGGFHVRVVGAVNSPINPSQIQVNGGASITRFLSGQYTVAFTVVPANTQQEQVVALASAQVGDLPIIGSPTTVPAGILLNARVPAAGSVTIRAGNFTGASVAAFTLSPLHVAVMGATP